MLSGRVLTGLLAVWFVVTCAAFAAKAATTERYVTDPRTGVALYGYDPVAYFIDRTAKAGDEAYEYRFAGVTWRFYSEANRGAFMEAPENFMPAFGGYDPLAVGEGIPLAGNPAIFAVSRGKLYLFAREESRAKFAANPVNLIESAEQSWPSVERKLVP